MNAVLCTKCKQPYPEDGLPYRCTACGGIFDFSNQLIYKNPENHKQGMWKYQGFFDFPSQARVISLGEGNTPLVWIEYEGTDVGLKCEYLNPTGSYKDRGSSILTSLLVSRSIDSAVEDSSGNAGASFAAYAAHAGIKAKIYIPADTSGVKRMQMERYGAELALIPGSRQNATDKVVEAAERGIAYASHAFLPFGMLGIATIAFEIIADMDSLPGTVVAPVGHGGLFLGLCRGFESLFKAGKICRMPHMIGVQASNCSPVYKAFFDKTTRKPDESLEPTIAEGVRVAKPVRGKAIIDFINRYGGEICAIPEDEILQGYSELAQRGFLVEPTSALVWCALKKNIKRTSPPLVAILTGTGLKYNCEKYYSEQSER